MEESDDHCKHGWQKPFVVHLVFFIHILIIVEFPSLFTLVIMKNVVDKGKLERQLPLSAASLRWSHEGIHRSCDTYCCSHDGNQHEQWQPMWTMVIIIYITWFVAHFVFYTPFVIDRILGWDFTISTVSNYFFWKMPHRKYMVYILVNLTPVLQKNLVESRQDYFRLTKYLF